MNYTDWIGTIGVSILLVAYFLSLLNKLNTDLPIYILLNILGAGIACYASVLLNYRPFILLEGTWTLVSIIGLIKFYKK
jgi:nicotinamide riboside transporter PnuC